MTQVNTKADVQTYLSAKQALSDLATSAAWPDLIILDLNRPDMDG